MSTTELQSTIAAIAKAGKGILAADESTATIKKRFDTINLESTESSRRDYREMLLSTKNLGEYISGVILFEETLGQKTASGSLMTELLKQQGIIPGIKVDLGLIPLINSDNEQATRGLDTLVERLTKYKEQGALFAKWRSVYNITDTLPSQQSIATNASLLARYAAACQAQGIVPIVEPEVLMDGDHTIERCAEVTKQVLQAVFAEIKLHKVSLAGMILKPNMVISGASCTTQASTDQVARMTIDVFKQTVPTEVPTINFLSGGQSDIQATENLQAMNALGDLPWNLSYSYGRALQAPSIQAWHGSSDNIAAGQEALLTRCKANSAANLGTYTSDMDKVTH